MVHIIASLAFSSITLGTSLFILRTLAEERSKILRALGLVETAPSSMAARPARIRPAGRWQATPMGAPRRRAVA